LELGSRAVGSFNNVLPILSSVKEIVAQLTHLRGKQKEYFMVLYLNARKQLIRKEIISMGTLTETLVHPREVFEPAIRHFASSIVLAHNHPSKNMEVSDEDIKLTEKLIQSGAILDIEVLDHIIITDDGSSDETIDRLKELIPRYNFIINHVWQPKNGFRVASARNNGIRHAKGEYLIFSIVTF